jgi:hypothetical protein
MPIEERKCLLTAIHPSRKFKSAFRFKQGYQTRTHDRMIVHYQDSQWTLFNAFIHAAIASLFRFA